MKLAATAFSFLVAIAGAAAILVAFSDRTDAPDRGARVAGAVATPATLVPTPLPATWIAGLRVPRGPTPPLLLSCLDANADGRLNRADDSWLFDDLDVPLVRDASCAASKHGADFYESAMLRDFNCDGAHRPVFLVVVAGGGSDLLDASKGDSLGLLDVTNAFVARAKTLGVPVTLTLSSGAIVGAEMAQTNLERMLIDYVAKRLTVVPCARAAMIGHSHGGVTISTVASALEDRFADRLLGVIVDRTNVIYDRPAENFPARVTLLNFFQTNEGWHGVALDAPNIVNFDQSHEMAPIAPSDGGGGPARVTHRSLDDSPALQQRMVDELVAWATSP